MHILLVEKLCKGPCVLCKGFVKKPVVNDKKHAGSSFSFKCIIVL